MNARGDRAAQVQGADSGVRDIHNDPAVGELAAQALEKVGPEGAVTVFEATHSDVDALRRVADALRLKHRPWLMDSQAKHAVIASGEADVLLRFPTRQDVHDAIWDHAAGSLLVEEAGGRVTDLGGRPLDFSTGRHLSRNEGLVASNGRLHDAVLSAVGACRSGP